MILKMEDVWICSVSYIWTEMAYGMVSSDQCAYIL